jgi:hypothetical protein
MSTIPIQRPTNDDPFCTHTAEDGGEDCGAQMLWYENPGRWKCPRGHDAGFRFLPRTVDSFSG